MEKKLLYTGKTNNVYALPNGNCLLLFKDDNITRHSLQMRSLISFTNCLNFSLRCLQRKFRQLVNEIKERICNECLVMLSAWIEGSDSYPHKAKTEIDNITRHSLQMRSLISFTNCLNFSLRCLQRKFLSRYN